MEKVKIFNIITSGLRREGITSTQLEFVKHLDRNRFAMTMAAVHNNDAETVKAFEKLGCRIAVLPERRERTDKYFWALVRELKAEKPDIVHIHGSSAVMTMELLAAKIAGVKSRIVHSRNTKADQAVADKLLRPLFYCLYTDALACGEDAGKWLFGNRPFTVIHNGKDFTQFTYNQALRERMRGREQLEGQIVVGHVGRFGYQKNHEFLLRVFAEFLKKHGNAVLYLMGEGGLKEAEEKHARDLGMEQNVRFVGTVTNVAERLQGMDIMVFPSRFEGLPNVVLEWQAEGLPCLISDAITKECAPSDLVEFASIEDEPQIWAEKMEQMLCRFTDREGQAKRGTQALKENGYDIADAAKQLEKIYLKLAER